MSLALCLAALRQSATPDHDTTFLDENAAWYSVISYSAKNAIENKDLKNGPNFMALDRPQYPGAWT
jgi:hypothetical protein